MDDACRARIWNMIVASSGSDCDSENPLAAFRAKYHRHLPSWVYSMGSLEGWLLLPLEDTTALALSPIVLGEAMGCVTVEGSYCQRQILRRFLEVRCRGHMMMAKAIKGSWD